VLQLQVGSGNSRRQISKLDLAYRLSNLAFEQHNRSMTDEIVEQSSTMGTMETHPGIFSNQSVRDMRQSCTITKDEDTISDESKTTSKQQSAAERRKLKRETLANYLKTNQKAEKAIGKRAAKNSGNLSRNGEEQMLRQSSKTSMKSQQSGQKRRTGSAQGFGTTMTPQKNSSSSIGKKIRRLGKPGSSQGGQLGAQVSASIEMVRTGGTKVTAAYRNSKSTLKSSFDPGAVIKSS